ncbi:MAG TPA: uracil-DNA glycosylase, partial [Tepidisphaeraceae bacterium]|nr:uracil-DNA glycosylase [Tepidisphaeraceae bacterium]
MAPLPPAWQSVLAEELSKPYFHELQQFVDQERQKYTIYPPEPDVFSALALTPYEQVKVFLLGQDPYPNPNQAHGLAFSVRPGVKPPPSLRNIFTELHNDLGLPIPKHNGCLIPWAQQGVLLLNTVLTVRAGQPLSHRGKGWEVFTDAIIQKVGHKKDPVVFALWGTHAQKKIPLIDTARHTIVTAA